MFEYDNIPYLYVMTILVLCTDICMASQPFKNNLINITRQEIHQVHYCVSPPLSKRESVFKIITFSNSVMGIECTFYFLHQNTVQKKLLLLFKLHICAGGGSKTKFRKIASSGSVSFIYDGRLFVLFMSNTSKNNL